jgi:beta-alanine--pyruvate transaminase
LKGLQQVVASRNLEPLAPLTLTSAAANPQNAHSRRFIKCFEKEVLVRAAGDTIAVSPPLTIEKAQIEQLFSTIAEVLRVLNESRLRAP